MSGTYKRPQHDATAFVVHALPVFKDAGMTLIRGRDARWLKPGGVKPEEYVKVTETNSMGQDIERQWRNKGIVELRRGQLWVRIKVVGPNEKELRFEMHDSMSQVRKLDYFGPETIMEMIARIDEMADTKSQHIKKLLRSFHLT